MKKILIILCLGASAMMLPSFTKVSKSNSSPKTDLMVAEWERAKTFTKEYLDVVTEESLAIKPKPEMRSLAEQMLHLADANYNVVGSFTKDSPYKGQTLEKMDQFKNKQALLKVVMESYDFVIARIKEQTEATMAEKIKMFDMFEMSRELGFAKMFEHQTHHRGQATVYLRLAGITPPQEHLF